MPTASTRSNWYELTYDSDGRTLSYRLESYDYDDEEVTKFNPSWTYERATGPWVATYGYQVTIEALDGQVLLADSVSETMTYTCP